MSGGRVLFWGRSDSGYSRNRIVLDALSRLGFEIAYFRPAVSAIGDAEAFFRAVGRPAFVWVPCFRQRDVAAAARWARFKKVPLVFDPLISAYQKQVFERRLMEEGGARAKRLLAHERNIFSKADVVIADTSAHAAFFKDVLQVPANRVSTVYVGAGGEFYPAPPETRSDGAPLEVLFYGSYIPLHGVSTIIEAAKIARGDNIHWTLLGDGPARAECERAAAQCANVSFEPSIAYKDLCARIHEADVLLGIFGNTAQASRVMPNKFFQSLASGRPVVTRESTAYPEEVRASASVAFVPPADPAALVAAVRRFADRHALANVCGEARRLYDGLFSMEVVTRQVASAISKLSVC